MNPVAGINLICSLLVLIGIIYGGYVLAMRFSESGERVKTEHSAYQQSLDDKLRAAGHSEGFIQGEKQIRALRTKYKHSKATLYTSWVGAIAVLILFPPIGIFLTGFCLIATFREGRKSSLDMTKAAEEIRLVRESMPER